MSVYVYIYTCTQHVNTYIRYLFVYLHHSWVDVQICRTEGFLLQTKMGMFFKKKNQHVVLYISIHTHIATFRYPHLHIYTYPHSIYCNNGATIL